jgi:hypothetical protein
MTLDDLESFEQDRRAFAMLKLALQGDADVAAGRTVSRADYKKRVAASFQSYGPEASQSIESLLDERVRRDRRP